MTPVVTGQEVLDREHLQLRQLRGSFRADAAKSKYPMFERDQHVGLNACSGNPRHCKSRFILRRPSNTSEMERDCVAQAIA